MKILALQGVGKHHESIALGIHVRQQLGLSTPKDEPASKLKSFLGYIKTNHILGKRTAEQLANLPELTDERIYVMGQRILELLEISCYQAQPMMFPLIIFLMIEATIKYGINASSCDAFTGFGVLLCGGFNDFQRGHEMARVAELILAKPGMNRMASRSIFVMEGLIKHWTTRLNGTLEPLLKGYQIGLDCGEGQSAGLCQSLHVTHTFYSGGSLKGFAEMIAPIVGLQNVESNDSGAVVQAQSDLDIHVVYLYGWKKLCGILPDDNEQSLDDIVKVASRTGNQSLRGYIFAVNLELLVFFGEWNTATNILVEAGDVRDALVATYTGVRFTCLGALIYLKAAQSSAGADRSMWKKNALKEIKLIRGWYKRGNVNTTTRS